MPNGRGSGMGQGRGQGMGRGRGIGQGRGGGLFGSSRSKRWTVGRIIGAIAAEVIGNWIDKKIEERKPKTEVRGQKTEERN